MAQAFLEKGFLVVISGPSGVGKTTFCQALLKDEPRSVYSVSATTRPPRNGEVQGRDYHFLSEKEFFKMRDSGGLLEWASVHEWYYGTPREPIERWLKENRIVLLDVDVQGGESIKKALPEDVFIFILPPSLEVLEKRLSHRGTDQDAEVKKRLKNAPFEIGHMKSYAYIVVNDKFYEAYARVKAIVEAEKSRISRVVLPAWTSSM
ncbi:MAG: guanylate kinase [Candidatus Eisenbacteria bacterium]|nr:guanylate kinase [Candidatus Eisenbacteria bacterium]